MRPEDILPDAVNERNQNGITIRKGSVGAFIANANILADQSVSDTARAEAETHLRSLVPALRALRLFEVFEIRDRKLVAIVEDELRRHPVDAPHR